MAARDRLTLVIPVYNEGANFGLLWREITSTIHTSFQALAIYDRNDDDTLPVIRDIIAAGETRLQAERNAFGRGVVGALETGFQNVKEGAVLVVMADLSDDLAQVDKMFALYQQGFDLVVASRYMKGGRLIGGPVFKQGLSRLSGLTLHWFRGLPVHDATNSFRLYDSSMLRRFTIESRRGFELTLELTVKAFLAGYAMTEVPAQWRDRTAGQSNFKLWSWLPHYLKWYVYAFQPRRQ
jgi:glycosyltransferase involved in cell wall biosynthesis